MHNKTYATHVLTRLAPLDGFINAQTNHDHSRRARDTQDLASQSSGLLGKRHKAKKAKIDLQTREGQPQSDGPGPQISWEAHGTVRAMQGPRGPSQSHLSQS